MNVSDYTDQDFLNKYRKSPISNPYIAYPKIIELLGNVQSKKILDLGCGGGDLTRLLANHGAIVDAVDISEPWIEICKKELAYIKNITTYQGDAANLPMIENASFDAVVMNMVLLNVDSKTRLENAFKEVSRVLKPGGSFIFTDLHPLCVMIPDTLTEQQSYCEGFSYFEDGAKFKSKVLLADGSTSIEFVDLHWSLETYSQLINDVGLFIYRIIEPRPIANAPELFNDYQLPEYILFHCKKL